MKISQLKHTRPEAISRAQTTTERPIVGTRNLDADANSAFHMNITAMDQKRMVKEANEEKCCKRFG